MRISTVRTSATFAPTLNTNTFTPCIRPNTPPQPSIRRRSRNRTRIFFLSLVNRQWWEPIYSFRYRLPFGERKLPEIGLRQRSGHLLGWAFHWRQRTRCQWNGTTEKNLGYHLWLGWWFFRIGGPWIQYRSRWTSEKHSYDKP